MTFALQGVSASKGIAIGKVHMLERGQPEVLEYVLPEKYLKSEIARFRRAVRLAKAQLGEVKDKIPPETRSDIAGFIDTHLLMLEDAAITRAPVEIIRKRRCNAEWALRLVRDQLVEVFETMDDEYLRTRKDDVDHVVNRIQRILLQQDESETGEDDEGDGRLAGHVVFADDVTPADAVLMEQQGVAAIVTEYGGPTSHTAILARSLRMPAVVGLHGARQYLRDEDLVVVDGRQGTVLVDPAGIIIRHYARRQRDIERYRIARQKLRRSLAVTADGERIGLQANVELPSDIEAATQIGAEGIGLYRTEYLFMNRARPPDEEEQYEAYAGLVEALQGAPVTIRTLDLGADKQVDGARPGAPATSNPALGLRAVRLCLKEPDLFRPQVRAILRASAHGPLRMMVPMLSNVQELAQVLGIVRECRLELEREGRAFNPGMPIGAMIEVPAAAVCADVFARHVDFLSIGTNDLIQYTIAIDRIDDEVSYLYDPLHLAVLRLVHNTIKAGQRAGIPVAMCGEMAGDARYTRLLLGLGLKEFSVHPNALLEIKQIVNQTHVGNVRRLTGRILRTLQPAKRTALLDQMNRGG